MAAERMAVSVRRAGTGLVAIALAVGASSAAGQSEPPVSAAVGGDTIQVSVSKHHGYPVVNIAELLGGFLSGATQSGVTIRSRLEEKPLVLVAGSPFFEYDGRLFQLANVPYRLASAFWLPAELLTVWWPDLRAEAANLAVATGPVAPSGPWRVIIDPGHGGVDPGSIGAGGAREKDVALAISRAVYDRLKETAGIEPVLTRDTDVFIPVRRRSTIAVEQEGDVFVSIHTNSFRDRRATGFETYFLSTAKTEEAREVALRENSAVQYEEDDDYSDMSSLEVILAGLDQNEHLIESRRLAGYAQNALRQVRGTPDRGVKQAGLWVLVGASGSMPTVLIEVGFISNGQEERSLADPTEQRRIGHVIARGLLKYHEYILEQFESPETGSSRE